MATIGGVDVSDGGTIYWGTLFSVLIGTPVYAVYTGAIWTLQEWSAGAGAALGGVRSTLAGFVAAAFAGITGAVRTSQETFIRSLARLPETTVTVPSGVSRAVASLPGVDVPATSAPVQLSLGPFTFAVGVFVALASLWLFLKGIQLAQGGLRG